MLGVASSFSPTAKIRIGARMPAARVDPIALTQFLINNKIVVDGNAPYGQSANSRAVRPRTRQAFLNITVRRTHQISQAPITKDMFIDKSQQFTPDKDAVGAGNHAVVEANQAEPDHLSAR
jgi:hypothetical protein